LTESRSYFISALVKITNKGIHNRFIDFKEHPLVIEEVTFIDGNSLFSQILTQEHCDASILLRTGTTTACPFVVSVPKRGFYMVSFSIPLNDDEMKIHLKGGGPNEKGISWEGSALVLIK
jgi:hypothetical protein